MLKTCKGLMWEKTFYTRKHFIRSLSQQMSRQTHKDYCQNFNSMYRGGLFGCPWNFSTNFSTCFGAFANF